MSSRRCRDGLELNASIAEFFHDACRPTPSATRASTRPRRPSATWSACSPTSLKSPPDDEPLALKLAARGRTRPDERVRQLRDVGDTSLYVSGFFAESLQRKLVDVDYYIQMGGAAYGSWRAASAATRNSAVFGEVYDELGAKFPRFVDVLRRGRRGRPMAGNARPRAAVRALAAHRLGVDGAAAARPGRRFRRKGDLQ